MYFVIHIYVCIYLSVSLLYLHMLWFVCIILYLFMYLRVEYKFNGWFALVLLLIYVVSGYASWRVKIKKKKTQLCCCVPLQTEN